MTDKTLADLLGDPTAPLASSKAEIERLLKLKAELEAKTAEINAGLAAAQEERKRQALIAIGKIAEAAGLIPDDLPFLVNSRKTAPAASKAKTKAETSPKAEKPAKGPKKAPGKSAKYAPNAAPARPARFFNPKTILDPSALVRDRLWSGLGSRQPAWTKSKKPIEQLDDFLKAKKADAAAVKEIRKAAGL